MLTPSEPTTGVGEPSHSPSWNPPSRARESTRSRRHEEDDEEEEEAESSERQLQEAAKRLRDVYYAQLQSDVPQRDVLFHCALGLSLTSRDEDAEFAASILHSLLDAGYMRHDCHLALAKLHSRQGFVLQARRSLNAALAEEPNSEEAREFRAEFDAQVKRDGKIAVYGALVLATILAIAFAYRRGTGKSAARS